MRLTCPDIGFNSPVRSFILFSIFSTPIEDVRRWTYRVDLPAPFDPTMAIRVSRPTSKLTRFKIIFELSYPNVTSESWSRGGESFSVSGNLDGYGYEGVVHIHGRLANTPKFLCFFCHWRSNLWKLQSINLCGAVQQGYHYFLKNFDLGLCLRSTVGIISPSVNEGLQMLAILHLCIVFTPQVSFPFGFC